MSLLLQQKKYGYSDMVTMSVKTSPFYSSVFAITTVISAMLPVFSIYITADFIERAIALYNGEAVRSEVYRSAVLMMAIVLYNSLIDAVMNAFNSRRKILFCRRLYPEMVEKRAKLAYRHIENPRTADLILRVCPPFAENVWVMYTRVLELVNLIVYVGGILIAMFTQVWWIALILFAASVPILYISTVAGKNSYDADKEVSKLVRRVNYLSEIMRKREAVEERSIFGTTDYLNRQYSRKFEAVRKIRQKVMLRNFVREKSGGIITTVYSVVAMLALLPPTVNGKIAVGMFISLMGAVFELADRLSWGVNDLMEDLARKAEYLKDLTEFMKLEQDEDATAQPDRHVTFSRIEFKDVSFRYPDTDKLILDRVSFVIEKGKHYSFVGTNGAGKTTITKLIIGLYTGYEGEILVDGRSLRGFTQSEIKGLSSVVYQDFAKYDMTLYDNIAVAGPDDPEAERKVKEALELVGLSERADRLPKGVNTPLGKIYGDGVDLSGGEWQRLAMARCVLNRAPLRILDEPTAALDPVSESRLYHNFERISGGTTTIFISHRLGSTRLADMIFVLEDGRIVESGPHAALMARGGVYRRMFDAQADWYRDEMAQGREESGNVW